MKFAKSGGVRKETLSCMGPRITLAVLLDNGGAGFLLMPLALNFVGINVGI